MKIPTPWSNQSKNSTAWSKQAKSVDSWANNVTKNKTTYTTTGKNKDAWAVNYQPAQAYIWDSSVITYDSTFTEFDYWVNNNQLNQKLQTAWSDSSV